MREQKEAATHFYPCVLLNPQKGQTAFSANLILLYIKVLILPSVLPCMRPLKVNDRPVPSLKLELLLIQLINNNSICKVGTGRGHRLEL